MKRIICLLLMLLLLLTACGPKEPASADPGDDGRGGEESLVPEETLSTGEDFSPGEDPSTEEDAAPEGTMEYVVEISDLYETILNSAVYMATEGGTATGEYLSAGSGYYCDADHDGFMDWIINLDSGYLILEGGRFGISGHIYGYESYKAYFTYSDAVGLVITMGEFMGPMSMWNYRVYDGTELVSYASMSEEMDYATGESTGEWYVNGVNVTETEYNVAIQALGELKYLSGTSFVFENEIDLDPGALESAAKLLGQLPYATEVTAADLDEDGREEYIVYLMTNNRYAPKGTDLNYGLFVSDGPYWADCCVVLSADGDHIHSRICSTAEVNAKLPGEDGSTGALPNGTYLVAVYEDRIYDGADGTYATVDLLEYLTFTDAYVQGLKVGDTIRLSDLDPSLENIRIESMEISDEGNRINFNDYEYELDRNQYGFLNVAGFDGDTWFMFFRGDAYMYYSVGEVSLPFTPDTVIIDNLTNPYEPKQLASLQAMFSMPGVGESERMDITVENGKVIEAQLRYHP